MNSTEHQKTAQTIGTAIRDLRVEKGLTQEGLAELMGVHKTRVSWIERGLSLPTIPTLIDICQKLETSPLHLVTEALKQIDFSKCEPALDTVNQPVLEDQLLCEEMG